MARIDERSFSGAIDLSFSAASQYLPIGEHGVVGDLRTVALVGTDGTIDWYCCPRFDSPSVFGAILDRRRGGRYRISPTVGVGTVKQLYFPTRTSSSRASSPRPASASSRTSCRSTAAAAGAPRPLRAWRDELPRRGRPSLRLRARVARDGRARARRRLQDSRTCRSRSPRESASASGMKASSASSRSSPARASHSSSRR